MNTLLNEAKKYKDLNEYAEKNQVVVFGDKARDPLAEPVVERVLVAGGFLEVVCVSPLNHLTENREHLRKVGFGCLSDNHKSYGV